MEVACTFCITAKATDASKSLSLGPGGGGGGVGCVVGGRGEGGEDRECELRPLARQHQLTHSFCTIAKVTEPVSHLLGGRGGFVCLFVSLLNLTSS